MKSPRYRVPMCVGLSVLSGVLLALSLPPANLGLLGWAAFAPLLLASRYSRDLGLSAGCGLLSAVVCAGVLTGVPRDITLVANVAGTFGGAAVVLAVTAVIASFLSERLGPNLWPLGVACAAVMMEPLSTHVFPVTFGISQHQNSSVLWVASYTGVWGVSFLLWLASTCVAGVLAGPARGWRALAACGAAVAVVFAAAPNDADSRGRALRVAAIQAPWSDSAAAETLRAPRSAELVVWPEHVLSANDLEPRDTAKRAGVYLLASVVDRKGADLYNSACLIAPDGTVAGSARKRHLFGIESSYYKRGGRSRPISCGAFTAGIAICFDTEFTDVARDLVRDGAQIVLVPNSDPDAPNYLFNHLHSAIMPFRAAENGVPIVWAECDGLSAVFDGSGGVISRAHAGGIDSASGVVRLRDRTTFYTRAGDYFPYLCGAVLAAVVAASCLTSSAAGKGTLPRQFRR